MAQTDAIKGTCIFRSVACLTYFTCWTTLRIEAKILLLRWVLSVDGKKIGAESLTRGTAESRGERPNYLI